MQQSYHKLRDKELIEKINQELYMFPDFVSSFALSIESSTSPLTRLNYINDLSLFFDWLSSNKFFKERKLITISDIDRITSTDIEKFLSFLNGYEKNGTYYSNSEITKARKLSAIRCLLKHLFDRDKIVANVASKVKTPKIRSKEIVRLETDEVAKLLNIAENSALDSPHQSSYNKNTQERDIAMLSLMLGTGIRVSECVGINLNDIDFTQNAFKITRKGGNQVVLYFSDEVKESLIKWINKREKLKELPEEENALFISLQNKRITVRAVENLVKKYAKLASPLKKISPHKLRSTYGTNLYRETKDIYIVADVLGHKDVNTTKKHYAAISEDIRRSAANKVKLR